MEKKSNNKLLRAKKTAPYNYTVDKNVQKSGSGHAGGFSKDVRRQLGQFGALAFLQFDVRGDGLVAEPADDVIKSVR